MLGVVRHGSTTRAAQAMHLSQPAVARSVLQLEEACGMPLFMRGARGMMPTPLGSQLAARIEAMLQHLGSGAADAQAAATLAARRPPCPSVLPRPCRQGNCAPSWPLPTAAANPWPRSGWA